MARSSIVVVTKWWVVPSLFVIAFSPLRFIISLPWLQKTIAETGFIIGDKAQ